jgi:hypothetical protein
MWVYQDGLAQFSAPRIETDAIDRFPDPNTPNSCVYLGASYPNTYAVVYQSPEGSSIDPNAILWRRGDSSWADCEAGAGDGDASIGNVRLALNDINESAAIGRNLFFAGVVAGVLGALGIEIFNGIFDVIEARRGGRDEQEDEPYDPGPRGYL